MNTHYPNTAAAESSEKWGESTQKRLLKAIDCAAMSIAYGREAADHYGVTYGVIRSVYDGIRGFIDGFKRPMMNPNT